jgi:Sulfotransferase family
LQYDVQRDLDTVDWIRAAYPAVLPPASPSRATPGPGAQPIFVVSLPRTGSSLVDRILGSHPLIRNTGERPEFAAALVAQVHHQRGVQPSREALIQASAQIDFRPLGEDYRRRMRRFVGDATHFTDKMPLNYLYCGLIGRALPEARIVHVQRGPLATLHAIHRMLFEQGYPFAYDLRELADYYVGYRRLMAHWQQVLPGRLVEVSYETLVQSPESEVRRVLGPLGLPFDPACLAFERNPDPVSTASASQVRQPLYTDALAVWRHYADLLAPAQRRLESAGIAVETP